MDLTDAYENGAHIPDVDAFRAAWPKKAAAFRDQAGGQLDLSYGPSARNRYDLFAPEGAARGLLIFVHGGYWRITDKSVWSHLGGGAFARGWAVALPSYTLAPEARISQITAEVASAIEAAARGFTGPVVLAGHSAGGHLIARMRAKGVLTGDIAEKVQRIVPISPLSDLRPLMQTDMNADLRLDADEAARESPMLQSDLHEIETHVWVGGDERPAFLDQARWLGEAWGCPVTIDPGKHHFDVIEALEDPSSAMVDKLLK